MEQMNVEQLLHTYTDHSFQEAFARLYSLSLFFQRALVPEDYTPPKTIPEHVSLTAYGESWLERIRSEFEAISEVEARFALLSVFNHAELFIDIFRSHHNDLIQILSSEILGERFRFPWVYGRELYDRFFDEFPKSTDSLTHEQTKQLLRGTSPGVFQLRDILIGPYGALISSEQRSLRPPRTVPLWHCSDPTCQALHPVLLAKGQCKALDAAKFLKDECKRLEGFESEWDDYFNHFDGSPDWYDDMHLDNLPWLLANSFSEGELRLVFEKLLTDHSKELRSRVPETGRFKKLFAASPSEIAKRLGKSECFQLILLQKDTEIAEVIESLIDRESIKIPTTEIRDTGLRYGSRGWFSTASHCSRFGIRSVSDFPHRGLAMARLRRLIKELYFQGTYLSHLMWALRHVRGEGIYEKLDYYLQRTEPSKVLADLVLANPEFLEKALRSYRCPVPNLPVDAGKEAKLINKLLWKLGFDIPLYPEYQDVFWRRLERLLNVARTSGEYAESEKEAIRSAAVNFFVSLEEILDYSLSFITWVLLSDHFGETKFECNFDKARMKMAETLNGRRFGSSEPLKLDPNGKNTLYPLVIGFAVLSELCKELLEGKQGNLRRPDSELPGFHGKTELQLFPFLHRVLLLDIRQFDQNRILDFLSEITRILEIAEICNIRNRLEHRRTDFPSQEEIEKAIRDVSDVIERMEKSGICPLVYVPSKVIQDQFGRTIVYYKDYRNREIELYLPPQYEVSIRRPTAAPTILTPWIHLGESIDILSFRYSETSEYARILENYPRRRTRMPD
jgi:hypothetical protein